MAQVKHRVGIRGSVDDVFQALTDPGGLIGWRPTTAANIPGVPGTPGTPGVFQFGQTLTLGFGGVVSLSSVVRELQPQQKLTLTCPDGPGPWHASELSFALTPNDGQVFVTLTHRSDTASDDDFLYFNTKWPVYLLSLRDYIETGQGRPSPNDTPIFHGDNVSSNTE